MKKKLILASSSPRRKDILTKMGLKFEIIPSDYDEILESLDFSYEKIEDLAYNKAKAVLYMLIPHSPLEGESKLLNNFGGGTNRLILSADTVVVLENKILGKPKSETEAFEMIKSLSGKKHSVITSICLIDTENNNHKILSTTSYVEFEDLTDEKIKNYIEVFKPLDKAGSYGIQELPEGFIKNVEGSIENIIGLCSDAVSEILSEF